ncbi:MULTISPECIES: hypothetical protein [Bacillus cereus group]|uniref:Uncharacterized protein n=5 Tax=Bacillus thuringiensis TaxID=1428 RepID=A0A9W4AID9_BACTO|nr:MULTISPECIES: hypothetical protein [Bacillus cereus group]MEB8714508.1 hypothetical protein [Bacillus cereus]ADU03159.1 hypothetical protein pBMB0558_00485 [Bacillus thuringiensis serovar chinensis CT-43]AEA19213.1 hypothetical protein CT43_P127031 [Bacillus thuringiensis serovar chinensis CT-43]AGG04741.1 hypothetical protein H175_107p017 [Bacillus thuringiensis serovar thuringiensis str. IS5056]ARP61642.1 hypothetical protein CAB88_32050 [Bacillus thuringiensis]
MSIEQYINLREAGKEIEEIQKQYLLSEATLLTLELGYKCYGKNISLHKAINLIDKIVVLNANDTKHTSFSPSVIDS